MELIKPLLYIVENDKELHDLVAPSISNYVQSDLLLSQDILWVLFASFPERLDFLYSLLFRTRYWCVGQTYNDEDSQLSRFAEEGIWEAWFNDTNDGKRQLKFAKEIKKRRYCYYKIIVYQRYKPRHTIYTNICTWGSCKRKEFYKKRRYVDYCLL